MFVKHNLTIFIKHNLTIIVKHWLTIVNCLTFITLLFFIFVLLSFPIKNYFFYHATFTPDFNITDLRLTVLCWDYLPSYP